MEFKHLSQSINIGKLTIKNRICMPAIHMNWSPGGLARIVVKEDDWGVLKYLPGKIDASLAFRGLFSVTVARTIMLVVLALLLAYAFGCSQAPSAFVNLGLAGFIHFFLGWTLSRLYGFRCCTCC